MVSWLINLVFGCILEMEASGFTNGGLWKGEGKRGIKNRWYLGF